MAKIIEFSAFDGLGLEEVVFLELDAWNWLSAGEGGWDVLNDDSAGQGGEFALEGNGLLAEATAYINQYRLLGRGEGADFFLDGVGIDPVIATLQSHQMAKTLHLVGMLRHPFEGAELGVERPLEGGIITRCDVLIFSVLEERRKRLVDLIETIEPIVYNQPMFTPTSSSTMNSEHLHVGD